MNGSEKRTESCGGQNEYFQVSLVVVVLKLVPLGIKISIVGEAAPKMKPVIGSCHFRYACFTPLNYEKSEGHLYFVVEFEIHTF